MSQTLNTRVFYLLIIRCAQVLANFKWNSIWYFEFSLVEIFIRHFLFCPPSMIKGFSSLNQSIIICCFYCLLASCKIVTSTSCLPTGKDHLKMENRLPKILPMQEVGSNQKYLWKYSTHWPSHICMHTQHIYYFSTWLINVVVVLLRKR